MSDRTSSPRSSGLPARLGVFVLSLALVAWFGARTEYGKALATVLARSPHPGVEAEPFFPAADPSADALLGATRLALTHRGDRREAQRAAEKALENPGEDGAEPAADSVVELPPVPDPLGPADLKGRFEALSTPPTEGPCFLSLYFPARGARGGPFVVRLDASKVDGGVSAAAADLWAMLAEGQRAPDRLATSRLKLDCVVGGEREFPSGGGYKGAALDKGIDGIVLRHKDAGEFHYLPSWGIEGAAARRKLHVAARLAARRHADWSKKETTRAAATAFRTRAWVESGPASGDALPVARANVDGPPLEYDAVAESIAAGGRYLTRETDSRGKLTYHYDDRKDADEGGYNILRHAGSVYSMVQAYRVSGDPAVLAAAERGVSYYRGEMKEDPKNPGEWFVLDGRRAKLGGVGLGLLMFVELEKVAPGRAPLDVMEGMAKHIERMQLDSGEFLSFYNWDGRETSTRKSIFYSGEAILGLIRLHQLTGEQRWLDVAVKGADFLVHHRWTALGLRLYIPPDAWLTQALVEMDRVAPDDARADYAFDLSEVIARQKLMDESRTPPDLLGGDLASLHNLPSTATAGSYGEALTAGARLEARRRPGETRFRRYAELNARYQLRNQLRTENTWYLPNPARALGGWRSRMDQGEIRNDHVQHNVSGLFGILPLLREDAPDVGWWIGDLEAHRASKGDR